MSRPSKSSSSSASSRSYNVTSASSLSQKQVDLSTDLRLGLSISASQQINDTYFSGLSGQGYPPEFDWPVSESSLSRRSSLVAEGNDSSVEHASFFVKVYMEGIPIGRKLNLLAHDGYHDLIQTLDHMFDTNILWGDDMDTLQPEKCHVLTYEDEEGDLMMVGDVPWAMFLSTVKRLKITRVDTCGC